MVKTRPRKTASDRGLTIVELLVTLIVASIVSAATFTFFAGQQKVYDIQTEILNTQQNLWAAMETLSRYARAAGGGMTGCVRPDPDDVGPEVGDPVPGGNASPLTGLRVWNNGVFSRVPPLWIRNGVAGAPDTLTIAYGDGASGAFRDGTLAATVPAGMSAQPFVVQAGQAASFRVDEFALLVERNRADLDRICMLFQITSIDLMTNTINHSSAGSLWNTAANNAQMLPWDAIGHATDPAVGTGGIRSFGNLTYVQFAINTAVTPPTLTMNILTGTQGPQVLAEGIEDMQIAYACDLQPALGADGVLTEGTDVASRLNDEWTYNQTGDVEPARCNWPGAIRMTLMARSINPDSTLSGLTTNAKVSAEDGLAGSNDLFRHRVASATVYPRN